MMTHLRVILALLLLTVAGLSPFAYAGNLITIDIGADDQTACDGKVACFIPYETIAFAGEPVSFHNTDELVHTIVFGDPQVTIDLSDMKILGVGETYTTSFSIPGQYYYYCSIHPWKTGLIEIKLSSLEELHELVDSQRGIIIEQREKMESLEDVIEQLQEQIEDLEKLLETIAKHFPELLE